MYGNVLIFYAVIVFVAPASVNNDAQAEMLEYEFTNDGYGNFNFSYRISNNDESGEETGKVVNACTDDEHVMVEGISHIRQWDDVTGTGIMYDYQYRLTLDPVTGNFTYMGWAGPTPAAVVASLLG